MKIRKPKLAPVTGASILFQNYQEFVRPSFTDRLRFPDDLTSLQLENISELIGKFTQLLAFANAEACRFKVDLMHVESAETLRRRELMLTQPAMNSLERWRRDSTLDLDMQVMELERRKISLRTQLLAAETARDNFDRYVWALSRELSRRGFDRPSFHSYNSPRTG